MLTDILFFLLLVQFLIFLYFLILNSFYTISNLVALVDIRGQRAVASGQHITDLASSIHYRPISILVPAFNEELTVGTSLKFMLLQRFPEYEIVVVNDGSTDRTLEVLKEKYRLVRIEKPIRIHLEHEPILGVYVSLDFPNLTVVDKANGGKADALNAGINVSQYPLVCSVDADSLLEADALMRASKLFVEDRTVVATGGIVRVLNGCAISQGKVVDVLAPKRMIECFQSVEYIRGFLVGRTFWNCANSMLIVSGAFGIFRKDILIAIDGYRKTVGEDIDVVVRMHRHCIDRKIPHRIVFVPDPVCWTQVPVDYVSLLKQRNRWHRGLIDCLRYNRGMIFNPKYGYVGMVALPYYVLVEALGPLVEITGYASFVVCYFLGMANREMALIFIVLAVVWGMSLNVGAILLDNLIYRRYRRLKDLVKVSSFAFTEYLGYRQLVVVERLIATLTFFRRHWDQPTRKTMVSDE